MFEVNNNSGNIFYNVLKNYKKDSQKNKYYKNDISTTQITSTQRKTKIDYIEYIGKLPTYDKICILQSLLKEMDSIKERFEKNKIDMLERITINCKEYFKSQIGMKSIFDYCISDNPEKYYNYILVENNEEILGKERYKIIYDVMFLIRNNNDILLNLIKNCPSNSFDQFSNFLVNFFFNNTIDSSFNEEELIIIIYLIIEQTLLNEKSENYKNDNKIFSRKCFIHYLFKYLTRKPDVRSFTYSVLYEHILRFEEFNDKLSIDSKSLKNSFFPRLRTNSINMNKPEIKNRNIRAGSFSFKKADLNEISKAFTYSNILKTNDDMENIEDFFNETKKEIDEKINADINIETIEIEPFYLDSDVNSKFLQEKYTEYELKNDKISIAMRSYILNNINEVNKSNSEIFSNSIKILLLKKYKALNIDNYGNLNEKIQKNYEIITNFIDDIIKSLNENIISLPYIIKTISSILYFIINKKHKDESAEYQTLIILSNFLIGNIIIPLISNPYFNGLLTKGVLSKITKENLEIVSKILAQIISGKLFSNIKESEYTIFNKYIINILPKIFKIINTIISQKNFKLSHAIQNLINTNKNSTRNINYNFFEENQENLQQQNICFTWLDLIIFIDMIHASNNLDKIEVYSQNKIVFEKFLEMKAFFYDEYNGNNLDLQTDFFVINKFNYSPYLTKQIECILEEDYFPLNNKEEENVLLIKKFFTEILDFINKLSKNNIGYMESELDENNLLEDRRNINSLINRRIKYKRYLQIFSDPDTDSEDKNLDLEENNIDIDFRHIVFPNIIETIKNELGHNIDTIKAKRLTFYASYLQIHIDDLEEKYKENNYTPLIMEIIKKLGKIINEINIIIINQFYLKVKDGEKLNMIIKNNYLQTKKMEKCICIQYLFDKLNLPCKLIIIKDESGKIKQVKYEKCKDNNESNINSIQSFIDFFPNFRILFINEEDTIDMEENIELDTALKSYFKDLKSLLKKETIMERYSKEELKTIFFELENYILQKLFIKLFPENPTKKDSRFYKKCCRLSFLKPESLIKDKKTINEKLWQTSIILINELDNKLTPVDKVEKFRKAFEILQNSLTFSSGKKDLGIDDTVAILIYVMIKAKPKNIFSNSKYCQLFLDSELSKRIYGILLSQIEMVKNIIYDMKYTDLIGVSEEEFGKDED